MILIDKVRHNLGRVLNYYYLLTPLAVSVCKNPTMDSPCSSSLSLLLEQKYAKEINFFNEGYYYSIRDKLKGPYLGRRAAFIEFKLKYRTEVISSIKSAKMYMYHFDPILWLFCFE